MEESKIVNILVIWRGHKFIVEINPDATLKEFGRKLQYLTNVKSDTMHLLIPRSSDNSSKKLTPFSDDHSSLSLRESSIIEGKSIRMMGVFENEIKEVSEDGTKADLRIAGFDEEERRHRQRMLSRPNNPLKLPQGTYIFCDFRTLHLPGIELKPPASEALKRMHMLAADPGIVAIMNKHRWRVGIMTEMAPIGYVGISPKCILGLNKNHGEEISLRLRTDDLKGFRKYESIKKTLLHELAHMIYSEHDVNFYALDKQLNQEAATLDWTKSRSHTLSGHRHLDRLEEEPYEETTGTRSHKLGGNKVEMATARSISVAAAYLRSVSASTANVEGNGENFEHEPDGSRNKVHVEPDPDDSGMTNDKNLNCKAYHNDDMEDQKKCEEHKDFWRGEAMQTEPYLGIYITESSSDLKPDCCEEAKYASHTPTRESILGHKTRDEPDPDDFLANENLDDKIHPDEGGMEFRKFSEPDPDDLLETDHEDFGLERAKLYCEPDPDECMQCDEAEQNATHVHHEPDPDERTDGVNDISNPPYEAPDLSDIELQRIQDPVSVMCTRLQKTIETLKSEVTPVETTLVMQTLFKIIRNVIEHPDDVKFRRLRKANPHFQKNVAKYKAAMDVLFLVGFNEDIVSDEIGRSETYVVLKRNDPGLLWLAKSSLEMCMAC